jgi:tetratricopeptide (TPR) repeat protein
MGFWRREVIEPALAADTARLMREQVDWIAREPSNVRPYYQLALLYRMQRRHDEALGLLLEAVRLDPSFAAAHIALAELYAADNDTAAAWRHARAASACGDGRGVEMLRRHQVVEG